MSNDFLLCFVPLETLTFLGGGGGAACFSFGKEAYMTLLSVCRFPIFLDSAYLQSPFPE